MKLLDSATDVATALDGRYDPFLVAVSLFVAVLVSHSAISMTRDIATRRRDGRRFLLRASFCSATLGSSIWALHFVGMIAFALPLSVEYAAPHTLLSVLPAILTGMVAVYAITGPQRTLPQFAPFAVLVTLGIAAMHSTGMAAMVIDAEMRYSLDVLIAAVLIGSLAATLALRASSIAAGERVFADPYWQRLAAALAFSVGVAGIHYLVMGGTYFFANPGAALRETVEQPADTILDIVLIALMLAGIASFTMGIGRRMEIANALRHEMQEREKVEAELRMREAQLRAVFDNTPVFLNLKDRDGRFVLVNRKYEEWLDKPESEIVGCRFGELTGQPPRAGHVAEMERKVMETGRPVEWEDTLSGPDGRTCERIVFKFPVKGRDGGIMGVGTAAIDISARKQAEDGMREAVERAELANRVKSEFLAHMSHELRTPLNSIIGFSEALLGQFVTPVRDPKVVEYLENIHGSGSHLLAIVSDLLDLSKIEAGAMEIAEDRVSLPDVIRDTVRLIEDRANNAGRKLAIDTVDGLPALRGDTLRVRQILLNLFSNAVKFTDEGGRIDVSAGLSGDGGLFVSVTDNGMGIAADMLPKITDPFVQVAGSVTTRKHEGTGLGLALVKRLVEAHEGTLEIESVIGKGTSVTVRFPAERVLRTGIDHAAE